MTTLIFRTTGIRTIEQAALQLLPPGTLIARAGLAVAMMVRALIPENGKSVWLFAGPGNNGGDAFEAAIHLKSWFYRVNVIFSDDAAKLPPDAREAHAKWLAVGGKCTAVLPAGTPALAVDGLLGIGLSRPVEDALAERIAAINALSCPILAIDIPSGLSADTGKVLGACVRATATLTFIGYKPGLFTGDAADYTGEVTLDTLDLDIGTLAKPVAASDCGRLITAEDVRHALHPRSGSAHKGSYGSVAVFGGATGMTGAAFLAGRAALKLGAGKVFLGLLDGHAPTFDSLQPELMVRMAENLLEDQFAAIAGGPGLGKSAEAVRLLQRVVEMDVPLVLDADALNLVSADTTLQNSIATRSARSAATIMTPHPGEAAKLLNAPVAAIESDRIAAARTLAQRFRASIVLKGAGSIIAHPDGSFAINTSGNPGMASGGMGDVLTGMIVALLAQGVAAPQALELAVWLHGDAADALVSAGTGPVGLTASEVTDSARNTLNQLIYGKHPAQA